MENSGCEAGHWLKSETSSRPGKDYQLFLYAQAQITCDDYDHDHHTDDVKDVHCVLTPGERCHIFEGRPICNWRTQAHLVTSVKVPLKQHALIDKHNLYKSAHYKLLRPELSSRGRLR